jgi:hypothetical protein
MGCDSRVYRGHCHDPLILKYLVMKTIVTPLIRALLFGGTLCLANSLPAQTQRVETVTTTTAADGTISEFGPQFITVRTEAESQPRQYRFSERTVYVDEAGSPVSASIIKAGAPATIYYTRVGDALIADKVMVRTRVNAPTTQVTQTTTTTSGVISEFGAQTLAIQAEGATEPLNYGFSETTTYVDELGNPVSVRTIKSGQPVSVQYTRVGDRLIASKVIVRGAAQPAVPVSEEKTTTIKRTVIEE